MKTMIVLLCLFSLCSCYTTSKIDLDFEQKLDQLEKFGMSAFGDTTTVDFPIESYQIERKDNMIYFIKSKGLDKERK